MKGTQHFGYGTFKDWLAAIDPERRVFLREYVKTRTGGELPLTYETHTILAAQDDEDGHLHYILVEAAKLQRFDRMETTDEQKRVLKNAQDVFQLVTAWVIENVEGTIMRSTPALPDDRTYMTGWPEFIEPIKEGGKVVGWRRRDAEVPAEVPRPLTEEAREVLTYAADTLRQRYAIRYDDAADQLERLLDRLA